MKSLNIGVIGAGLMGHGIAYLLAAAGHTVRIHDPSTQWRETLSERLESGMVKKIQTRQQFKLDSVKNGVAVISTETIILTPVRDPALEAQLVQRQTAGTIRFDIERGRVLSQQMEQDKQVVGFRGETSALNYEARFSETLLSDGAVASRPKAGPEPPPGMKLRR